MTEKTIQTDNIQQEANRLLLASYAPASVIIDAEMHILQVYGHTGPYLELTAEKTSFNLLKTVRDGLALDLRTAINAARKGNHPVMKGGLQIATLGTTREVRVTVIPLKGPPIGHYFLVIFEEITPSLDVAPLSREQTGHMNKREAATKRIAALELELATMRTKMQEILEERETSSQEAMTTNQDLGTRNEQLKVAQERADAIVETVREPLVVLSDDLRIERANDAFYQFFKVVPEETEGSPLYDLGNGQWNIPQLRMLLEQVHTTDQPFHNFEVEHTFPLIGHKIMLLNARRIREREHKPTGNHLILLAIEDITERKELERQKDALLNLASHELRTPITSAKLTLQILQRRLTKAGNEQSALPLGQIDAHLNQLTSLLDGFLDATAIETGKLSLHLEVFAIDDVVNEVCKELQRTTASHRLVFAQEALAEVYGDRMRTGEVLSNLLTNAIKYASPAEPIEVRAIGDAGMVTVSVQDRGEGIPKDQQSHIFERFYRRSDSKQKHLPGVGLGLYLAAEITKQQGGQIWVESVPGKGTTFFFTIPRHPPSGGR